MRTVVAVNGELQISYGYDNLGRLTSINRGYSRVETNAAVDLIFGYTGKQLDDATGLQHNLFRWYDSALGQWLSEDPLGFEAGDENLKRYVGNEQVRFLDPTGLWQEPPSSFPIDPKDKSVYIVDSVMERLTEEGMKAASVRRAHDYGCGDLAAKRIGLIHPRDTSNNTGQIPFPGVDGVLWFSGLQGALSATDDLVLVAEGKIVRILMFQTNRPPVAIDTPFELRFGAYGQVDPRRIEWGLFNFATPHWDGSRYLWEYIDDGHTDRHMTVSYGNLPFRDYRYYYFGVVEITPEMAMKASGLPPVPWENP
jgi:RHS repeat-associated protein